MTDEFNLLKWLKSNISETEYSTIEHAMLYGVSLDVVKETIWRRELESHYNFYCVDWIFSSCKGPGRKIKGIIDRDLDVYICWRHLRRRERVERNDKTLLSSN